MSVTAATTDKMSNWARRMHRRAATLSNVVTACGHLSFLPYPRRMEKVKFGVPLEVVCKDDIPGPLLVLILKLNKEAPTRQDVFRKPGHESNVRKLVYLLQTGRLPSIGTYSVHTIASVLKKFLRKLPGGVFGEEVEMKLFESAHYSEERQIEEIRSLLMSLPMYAQRILVLFIGTFRVMANNAERAGTGMTCEALGVSVAPSFFHSCVSGKTATMEDVQRFKLATRIMRKLIEQFTDGDIFGRDNYVYYARVTGRILRVNNEWICSFLHAPMYPTDLDAYARYLSLEAQKTWLQCQFDRRDKSNLESKTDDMAVAGLSKSEECSTSAMGGGAGTSGGGLGVIPEHSLLDSCARLSSSLEDFKKDPFKVYPSTSYDPGPQYDDLHHTKSLNLLPQEGCVTPRLSPETRAAVTHAQVHHSAQSDQPRGAVSSAARLFLVYERQCARMRTRSDWFLESQPPAPQSPAAGPSAGGDRRVSRRRRSRRAGVRSGGPARGLISLSDPQIEVDVQPCEVAAHA